MPVYNEFAALDLLEVEDDADDLTLEELADFIINEDDVPVNEVMVIEEPKGNFIPGTELVEEEDHNDDSPPRDTDWANDQDHSKFIAYIRQRVKSIPKHSGNTIVGCERAKAYLESCKNEISKSMRTDIDGKIDEQEVDSIRREIDDSIEKLDNRIKKLRGGKTASLETRLISTAECKKCASVTPMWHDVANDKMVCMHCEAEEVHGSTLTKQAGTPVLNVFMTPFEKAIVGTIINSTVSAGKNIEETYELLKNKYNFTPREELAIQQLVADYGYPIIKDRGRLNESTDPSSGDGIDFSTQYHA